MTIALWVVPVSDISTMANKLIITPFGRAVAVYKASPSGTTHPRASAL